MTSKRGTFLVLLISVLILPTGYGAAIDRWDASNTSSDGGSGTTNVLIPGDPPQVHDVEAVGGVADEDWYRLPTIEGHSYEVRVTATQRSGCFDFFSGNFQILESDATTVVTQGIDYPGVNIISSYRTTFTAATTSERFVRLVGGTTCDGNDHYTIVFFDTTLVSPRWSTFAGFFTSYGFLNTTLETIDGTLTLVDGSGAVVATQNFTIPPGKVRFTDTIQMGVAASNAGLAAFSHDGPVGGIIADGFIQNFSVSPPVIQPVKFERGLKGD